MMKTKAAVVYKNNAPFQIEELDLQEPSVGEILVEIKATWYLSDRSTRC